MKKRSVLYTWVIEFSILLILMATMCVTLTLSARKKLLDEYTEITIQQQEKIETALNNSMSQIKTDAINLACNNVIRSFRCSPRRCRLIITHSTPFRVCWQLREVPIVR